MPPDALITTSRPCRSCGYDLKGLRIGGRCPECGEVIKSIRIPGPREGNMSDASPNYVRRVGLGFSAMSFGIVSALLGMVLGCFFSYLMPVAVFLGALAWVVGVYVVSMPRPREFAERDNPILDRAPMRLGVRVAAAAWPVFVAFSIIAAWSSSVAILGQVATVLAALTGLAAFAGLVPISIFVAEMQFWMSDDTGGWQLRGAAWTMLVFGVLFIVFSLFVPFLAIWVSFALVIAGFALAKNIIDCANQARWILRYQKTTEGRAERITERLRDRSERGGTVAGSTPCLGCGYELRGLPFGGRCPECGQSYADRTPFPVLPNPVRDDSPVEIVDDGPTLPIRPAVQRIGKPAPRDDSPIPLSGDGPDEPSGHVPPQKPASPPAPAEEPPIPFADDDPS